MEVNAFSYSQSHTIMSSPTKGLFGVDGESEMGCCVCGEREKSGVSENVKESFCVLSVKSERSTSLCCDESNSFCCEEEEEEEPLCEREDFK
jgi:hypothetical protein